MKSSIFVVGMSVILAGCLQTRAELRGEQNTNSGLQEQTRSQQEQVRSQPVAQNTSSAPSAAVAPMASKPMPTATRLEEIEEQMRQLSGRVDVVENNLGQLNAAAANDKGSGVSEKKVLEDRLMIYEEAIKKLEAQVQALEESRKGPSTNLAAGGGGKSSASAGAALHADGEAHFKAKKWKDAIVSFSNYRDQYPKGKLYADATYKIGVCFQELGMRDQAKPFLEEVTGKFPGTKEAKKASYRLKSTK